MSENHQRPHCGSHGPAAFFSPVPGPACPSGGASETQVCGVTVRMSPRRVGCIRVFTQRFLVSLLEIPRRLSSNGEKVPLGGHPRTASQGSDPRVGVPWAQPPTDSAGAGAGLSPAALCWGPMRDAREARDPVLPRPQQPGQGDRRLNSFVLTSGSS